MELNVYKYKLADFNNMKSPITGKEMPLQSEVRTMSFKNTYVRALFSFYKCEDSGEQYTTTHLDEQNIRNVEKQYYKGLQRG